jgi:hypothetical protein
MAATQRSSYQHSDFCPDSGFLRVTESQLILVQRASRLQEAMARSLKEGDVVQTCCRRFFFSESRAQSVFHEVIDAMKKGHMILFFSRLTRQELYECGSS